MKKVNVGIVGAAGLAAGRLIQLLLRHEGVRIVALADVKELAGRPIEAIHPFLRGWLPRLPLIISVYDPDALVRSCDTAFFATPHGFAMGHAHALIKDGLRVIDLSGDHRLKDPAAFSAWYRMDHKSPAALKKAVYGIPEFRSREIARARLIANPGCYPTSVVLGAAPLLIKGRASTHVVAVSVSGVSGAGRGNPQATQLIDLDENIRPYKVGTHQHTPEMEQELSHLTGKSVKVLFVPHVGGYRYGIITTLYLAPRGKMRSTADVAKEYAAFYRGKPFVRVLDPGRLPQLTDVVGSNFCDIGVTSDTRTGSYVVSVVIDNLIKGAAGLAVQNMNIACGFPETQGLL